MIPYADFTFAQQLVKKAPILGIEVVQRDHSAGLSHTILGERGEEILGPLQRGDKRLGIFWFWDLRGDISRHVIRHAHEVVFRLVAGLGSIENGVARNVDIAHVEASVACVIGTPMPGLALGSDSRM